jgi:hypothetical protein
MNPQRQSHGVDHAGPTVLARETAAAVVAPVMKTHSKLKKRKQQWLAQYGLHIQPE